MRQGCEMGASARLVISPSEMMVFLEDLPDPTLPVQKICSHHAETMRAPLGWSLLDNRSLAPAPVQEEVPSEMDETTESNKASEEALPSEDDVGQSDHRLPPKNTTLLGRAFDWTGPQHSVLTQDSNPDVAE